MLPKGHLGTLLLVRRLSRRHNVGTRPRASFYFYLETGLGTSECLHFINPFSMWRRKSFEAVGLDLELKIEEYVFEHHTHKKTSSEAFRALIDRLFEDLEERAKIILKNLVDLFFKN
jgi:hypothetical protein